MLNAKATPAVEDKQRATRYQEEEAEIKAEAERKQSEAETNFHKHEVYARSVTMVQIAIAIAAISALTKRRKFWFVSLLFWPDWCDFPRARNNGTLNQGMFSRYNE